MSTFWARQPGTGKPELPVPRGSDPGGCAGGGNPVASPQSWAVVTRGKVSVGGRAGLRDVLVLLEREPATGVLTSRMSSGSTLPLERGGFRLVEDVCTYVLIRLSLTLV